jgi:hypothetical protein
MESLLLWSEERLDYGEQMDSEKLCFLMSLNHQENVHLAEIINIWQLQRTVKSVFTHTVD